MAFAVLFEKNAERQFLDLEKPVRERIAKKLRQLENDEFGSRHLKHGLPFFVEEVGQFRIAFKERADLGQKRVIFVGNHKDYEKWYKSQ